MCSSISSIFENETPELLEETSWQVALADETSHDHSGAASSGFWPESSGSAASARGEGSGTASDISSFFLVYMMSPCRSPSGPNLDPIRHFQVLSCAIPE